MGKPNRKNQQDAARVAAQTAAASGAGSDTTFVTSASGGNAAAATKGPPSSSLTPSSPSSKSNLAITAKKLPAWQNAVYFGLVLLSISSLLYLVYVSMQSVVLTPSTLLNGTWHVAGSQADVARAVAQGASSTSTDNKNKDIVSLDLQRFVDYTENEETLDLPQEAMPLDVAPAYVKPLSISAPFKKGFSGGAKFLYWSGGCRTVSSPVVTKQATASNTAGATAGGASSSAATCTLLLYRGHWTLSVFPGNLSKSGSDGGGGAVVAAHHPFTLIATRLDASQELMEEYLFNKKVKYILGIMLVVAVIHYGLSSFQPPTQKQLKRDAALNRLWELKRQKEANELLAKEQKKND